MPTKNMSEAHSALLEAVSLNKKVKLPTRNEPAIEVSEFHLVNSGITDKDAVSVKDLIKSLDKKGSLANIGDKLTKKNNVVLKRPLEKPIADRVKRITGFEKTSKQLDRWNAIITRNRAAPHLKFPLPDSSINNVKITPTTKFLSKFRLKSELELKLEEIKKINNPVEEIEHQEDPFSTTLEELKERRSEAAKLRAQQSYREAKAQRQKKIKSKKYHGIQRKAKIKQNIKEFEELRKTNPEEALEKLEELEKSRATERMTLRHKNTGQWAKNKQIRAKYDMNTRAELAEQLSISRELTEKLQKANESEEENDIEENLSEFPGASNKNNPWYNESKTESEIDAFLAQYRLRSNAIQKDKQEDEKSEDEDKEEEKYHKIYTPDLDKSDSTEQLNKAKKSVVTATSSWIIESEETKDNSKEDNLHEFSNTTSIVTSKKNTKSKNQNIVSVNNHVNTNNKKTTKRNRDIKLSKDDIREIKKSRQDKDLFENLDLKQTPRKPEFDEPLEESSRAGNSNDVRRNNIALANTDSITEVNKPTAGNAKKISNPSINEKPKVLITTLPDDYEKEDQHVDDEEDEFYAVRNEAFMDDDAVEEFEKEKKEEIKKSQPEDLNGVLPGWGSWYGKNIKNPKRKNKLFITKFSKDIPRRDENKGKVIIFEGGNTEIKKHLVTALPYPFTSVADFEASIRAPVGREFVPEKSFSKLTLPAVKTSLGKIIEPMDTSVLVKMNSKRKQKTK